MYRLIEIVQKKRELFVLVGVLSSIRSAINPVDQHWNWYYYLLTW